jgi:hypothetical protein
MVIVEVPIAAVLLAVRVRTLLLVAGFVPNEALTPLGSPETASVTFPLKGLTSVIERVSVTLFPGATVREVVEGDRTKLPVPVPPPQLTPLTAKFVGTVFVTLFQVALNPMPLTLPPAGIAALYPAFVTVTFAPLWLAVPFQS